MKNKSFVSYEALAIEDGNRLEMSSAFFELMQKRRSLRTFSDEHIPKKIIDNIIKTAGTAPSGANKQPWTFCAVSNPEMKRKIREAAEKEEYENYHGRMSEAWLKDLEIFDTNWHKPFLETAPWLIVVCKKAYDIGDDGSQLKNYYVNESVGIACGLLLTAIHQAGLVALTHTPSPMNFLMEILNRPSNERPFLLIPIGKAARSSEVPDIQRKALEDISVYYE